MLSIIPLAIVAASVAPGGDWLAPPAPGAHPTPFSAALHADWMQPLPPQPIPLLLPAADAAIVGKCSGYRLHHQYSKPVTIGFSSPDGVYFENDTVIIRVNGQDGVSWQNAGDVQFTRLELETGDTDRFANYSGTNAQNAFSPFYIDYNYTVQRGDLSLDLDYKDDRSLYWQRQNGEDIWSARGHPHRCALPSPGAPGSLSAQGDVVAVGAARGTYARAATPDGVYGADREIMVAVHFGEDVSYSGNAPELALNVSGAPRTATYKSGNGTAALLFGYVVQPGDATGDLDYHTPRALTGAIINGTGQPADRALFEPGAVGSLSSLSDIVIDPAAVPLIAAGRADDGEDDFEALKLATNVDAIAVDGRTYAVASAAGDNAVQLIRVHGDGTLEAKDEARDSARLNHAHDVDAFYMGGAAYAIAAAHVNSSVHLLRIHGDSEALSAAGSLYDNSTLELLGVTGITAFEMGGSAYALAAGFTDDGVELVRINGDGSLEAAGRLRDNSTLALNGPFDSAVFDLGGEKHALVTGHVDDGIELVRINGDGSLEAVSRLRDNATLALDGPRGVAAFDLGGTMHALVASSVDDGVQLVRIGADGTLSAAGSASDGDLGFAKLDGANGVSAFAGDDGAVHALVASRGDDGIQLVRIGADGALLPVGWAPDGERGFGLDGAGGAAAFSMNGHRHALVSLIEGDGMQLVRMYAASVDNVTSAAANGTYAQGDEIDIAVAFSRPVNVSGAVELRLNSGGAAEYRSGNGTAELAFRYEVQAGDFAADLDYAGAGALSGAGSVRDAALPDLLVGRALPAAGTGRSLGDLKDILVDGLPPEVASVSSPNASRAYGIDSTIRVNVTFTENVVVDEAGGTPYIRLETGDTDRDAEYHSGSGERSLLFRYVVAADDRSDDLDYAGATALSANGGTIKDAAGNGADLDLSGLSAGSTLAGSSALVVDGVAPRIASVTSPDDNDTYGTGTVVNITVGFTEPVGFDPASARPGVPLDTGSGESRRAVCEPASGFRTELACAYTVGADDDTADLGYGTGSSLSLNGAAARDAAGNGLATALPDSPASATLSGSKDIALDTSVPEVLNVTSPNATGPHDAGSKIHIRVAFNGTVTIDPDPTDGRAVPTLHLATGEHNRTAPYAGGSGTNTLVFVYTVIAGDYAPDLNYTEAGALALGNRALVDEYGNREENPSLPDPASPNSLGSLEDIAVRTVPTVSGVGANYTGAIPLKVGKTVGVDVTFSEKVWVDPPSGDGIPHIELETGRDVRGLAVYSSGSGTHILRFAYQVHHADDVATLDYAGVGALKSNSAQIRGVGMLDADLSLPDPSSAGSLASANIRLLPNEPPSIVELGPRNAIANRTDSPLNVLVRATDPEMEAVTYSLVPPAPSGVAIDAETGRLTWAPTDADRTAPGNPYNITVLATDPHGANDTAWFIVTVVEPPPPGYTGPVISAIDDVSASEGEAIRFNISATGGRGPYVFSLVTDAYPPPPAGAIIHRNGTFSWTPSYEQNGTHAITAIVNGYYERNDTQAFTVAVADAEPPWNTPPTIEPVDPQSADEGERLVVNISAEDEHPPITYSLAGDPPDGAAIHPATGVFTWDIGYDEAGNRTITVSAADRYNSTSNMSFTVIVADRVEPNLPPEIAPIPALSATAREALEVQVNATDPNEGDALTFDLADPHPQGAAMAADGLFTWTPGRDQVGNHTLTVTVTDGGGLLDSAHLNITVDDLEVVSTRAEAAVFVGPRTVRIDYEVPLGAPAGHEGNVYGTVTIAGGGSADAAAVSGLGTRTHTVRLDGDAAGISQNGTIRLLAGLEGVANGTLYTLAAGGIPVAAGETARTLSPPGDSPVAAIETDGFVRALNVTAAGGGARAAINVTDLAVGANTTLPSGARVAIIASFAAVWLPQGANATGVPADGLIELYVPARAPDARDVADGFGVDAADVLEVRRVVEVGDAAARIAFSLPVRILLVGQAGGSAFYAGADGAVVRIVDKCRIDGTAAEMDSLMGGSGACQLDSGADKVVHTYHLTRFGTAVVGYGDTCSAALSQPEIPFGRVGVGVQSSVKPQEVRSTGTLPLEEVSITARDWTVTGGGTVTLPANATSVRGAAAVGGGGGAWAPLGGGAVDVPADAGGQSASVEFRVDVPQGALQPGAQDTGMSQAVTYTITCAAPAG